MWKVQRSSRLFLFETWYTKFQFVTCFAILKLYQTINIVLLFVTIILYCHCWNYCKYATKLNSLQHVFPNMAAKEKRSNAFAVPAERMKKRGIVRIFESSVWFYILQSPSSYSTPKLWTNSGKWRRYRKRIQRASHIPWHWF